MIQSKYEKLSATFKPDNKELAKCKTFFQFGGGRNVINFH
jgi:hypothetical protein